MSFPVLGQIFGLYIVFGTAYLYSANIDKLILHQANKQIVESITSAVNFPFEKTSYESFEQYGNNTICSIPFSINTVFKNPHKKSKLLCSGFGNGLAVASCIFTLDFDVYLSGVIDYKIPKNHKTREEVIKYWTDKLKGIN